MAYIMDMASGSEFPVEEPSYKLARETGSASCERPRRMDCPQLQLAMVEVQAEGETRTLPAATLEALINSLED